MQAELLYRNKLILDSGAIIEEVIWKLPKPDADRLHGFKYRLVYLRETRRVIGYDNERGKGDHRHSADCEEPYRFTSVEQLLRDFRADVAREEGQQ